MQPFNPLTPRGLTGFKINALENRRDYFLFHKPLFAGLSSTISQPEICGKAQIP
jgi:hypothetical protein